MNLMAWSEHFVTGITTVDQQHRALVEMINEAAPHLVSDSAHVQQAVRPLLDKLIQYAATHFKHEETLMQEAHLDPTYLTQHINSHNHFVEEVVQMRSHFDHGEYVSGSDLLQFLTTWLTFHILSEDKQMSRQIFAIRNGDNAHHAYASLDEVDSAPRAVYNAALIDLFALLNRRNRTLAEANEQIRSAKLDLERLNQELESRVVQRTHELAESNIALRSERRALVESLARLEETQSQLLQSEKMAAVGQLAAGVAHEINNPLGFVNSNLGSLGGYVTQLLKLLHAYEAVRVQLPAASRNVLETQSQRIDLAFIRDDVRDLLNESRSGLERVTRIVNDMRTYAQSDNATRAPADLNAILEDTLHVMEKDFKDRVRVQRELTPLPAVDCVSFEIGRLFSNLLRNAAEAITTNGTVTVRSGTQANTVWIEINDTGCGMSEELQRRIFEPFFTTHAVGSGTGLGLTMAWDIVQRHRGQLKVNSTPGAGSSFRIELPLSQP